MTGEAPNESSMTPEPAAGAAARSSIFAITAVIVIGLLLWRLAAVVLLAFGAILVAVMIEALAEPLRQRLKLPRILAFGLAMTIVGVSSTAALWVFGQQVVVQLASLAGQLPGAWSEVQLRLAGSPVGGYVLENLQRLRPEGGMLVGWASSLVGNSAAATAGLVIMLFAGLYLGFHPQTYVGGLVRLFPLRHRPRASVVLAACGLALQRWVVGQTVAVALMTVSVSIGLTLAGVPNAMALGVLAGIGQLVPVIGPLISMVPGLVVAAAVGPAAAPWALAVYVGGMLVAGNLVTPMLISRMVQLPMAVTLFAILALGVLLGPLGALFATPLAVVAFVAIRMVYIGDMLGDPLAEEDG